MQFLYYFHFCIHPYTSHYWAELNQTWAWTSTKFFATNVMITKSQDVLPYTECHFCLSGITIYKNIRAFDRDKPNTPNSDVQYTIVSGDTRGHFALESSHKPYLVLKKPLDYDSGDREFVLTVTASVSYCFVFELLTFL